MKKLNTDQAAEITPVTNGRTTKVWAALTELLPGEGLVITRNDWKAKHPPYKVAKRVGIKTNRKFEWGRMPDGSGWLIKRVG